MNLATAVFNLNALTGASWFPVAAIAFVLGVLCGRKL